MRGVFRPSPTLCSSASFPKLGSPGMEWKWDDSNYESAAGCRALGPSTIDRKIAVSNR